MALHVYFYGLISFIGNDKKTDALLITYPGHRPEIVTALDRTTAHDGSRIVFDGADGNGAEMSSGFIDYIPELSRVIKPPVQLKGTVLQHADKTFVNAYLKIPSGKLQVADFYENQGEFIFNDGTVARPAGCLGRLTYLYIGATSPVVVLGGKKELPLPGEGWALVRNSCATGEKDFKAHRHITTADNDEAVAKLTEADSCDLSGMWPAPPYYDDVIKEIKSEFRDIGQIECSNSRWP